MPKQVAHTHVHPTVQRHTGPPPSESERGSRESLTARWALWVLRHRQLVLWVWVALLVGAILAYPHLMSNLSAPDYSVTGSDSAEVTHLIATDFSAAGAEQDVIVFKSDVLTLADYEYQDTIDRVLEEVKTQPGVVAVVSPTDPGAQAQISEDGHAAYASLGLNGDDRERATRSAALQDVVAEAVHNEPVEAYLTGYSQSSIDLTEVENADVERAESIGIPVAFIVLILAVGAVVGGVVPLLIALASLTFCMGVLSGLVIFRPMDSFLLSIVTMLGVGISIDYSLFIVSRFQEELALAEKQSRSEPVETAVLTAMGTSGRTILFSGSIVMISLLSLFVVKSPLFQGMALGAVIVVLCTVFTAWTLLPALLAMLGDRVNSWSLPTRFRPSAAEEGPSEKVTGWARWARTVIDHPWLALPGIAFLVLCALPLLSIELGIDLGLAAISDTPTGKAEMILLESFTPGLLSPVQVLASHGGSGALDEDDFAAIDKFTQAMEADSRVDTIYSITNVTTGEMTPELLKTMSLNPDAAAALGTIVNVDSGSNRTIITIVTKAPIDSIEAQELVRDLRNDVIPRYAGSDGLEMLVGGETAQFEDLGVETIGKLPLVMAMVLLLSFCYLLVVFRSLLIPTKAVLMNLLATAAAIGLTCWVFVQGHLEELFDFTSVGFIQSFLPIMVFAVLFGLSMDYEVFLMGRMREEWLRSHDNDQAVIVGVAHTARAITSAAAIMAAVFGCFLIADVLELKEFGFALAISVVLDATVVRLLLVPAIMKLAGGEANWWIPRWLDRMLPEVRVE